MALSNISLTNTFSEQMVRLNQSIFELNKWIEGQAISQGNITVTGTVAGGEMLMNVAGNTKTNRIFVDDGSLAIPAITRSAGANVGIYFPAANAMSLVTASNSVIYLTGAGNVSIGATQANAKLDVEGTFRANGRSYFGANVGIGKTAPAYALDVVGSIFATGDITMESDARTKTDITPIDNPLSMIMALEGVHYKKIGTRKSQFGLIAQDALKIVPTVVTERPDGILGVNYQGLVAVLIEAIKELSKEIDVIKREIDV